MKFFPERPVAVEVSTGLGNGLVLNRQQAITLTSVNPFYWCMYSPLGLSQLFYDESRMVNDQ